MPTVTHDTGPQPVTSRVVADPASRVRRLVASAREDGAAGPAGLRELTDALARFDSPTDLRVRGGLGSGRRTLTAALRERRGWRADVDDLDELAAADTPPVRPPDIEIICLRTAPCRHEEAWIRRPRSHALLVVATGVDERARPQWAADRPVVDARDPADGSLDAVVAYVERALDTVSAVRLTRLAAELERLAVRDGIGELAETALCALDQTRHP